MFQFIRKLFGRGESATGGVAATSPTAYPPREIAFHPSFVEVAAKEGAADPDKQRSLFDSVIPVRRLHRPKSKAKAITAPRRKKSKVKSVSARRTRA